MSRKGVGRGRKYTTRVNRDGSQQYGRRGCFSMLLSVMAVCIALVIVFS